MIVAQCDAIISLADDQYYDRAWCSVEAMLVQTLKKSYNLHLWYEQVHASEAATAADQSQPGKPDGWTLREAPINVQIDMAKKKLTFEADRPKVMFLERQSRLLGDGRR